MGRQNGQEFNVWGEIFGPNIVDVYGINPPNEEFNRIGQRRPLGPNSMAMSNANRIQALEQAIDRLENKVNSIMGKLEIK